MKLIYNGRKYKIYSKVAIPKAFVDEDEKGYIYLITIGKKIYPKIGTSCDIMRRMTEHCKYYQEPIYIQWISPALSKYTTLRIEQRMKKIWKIFDEWEYIKNDRFIIPEDVEKITIKIKKEYEVILE